MRHSAGFNELTTSEFGDLYHTNDFTFRHDAMCFHLLFCNFFNNI